MNLANNCQVMVMNQEAIIISLIELIANTGQRISNKSITMFIMFKDQQINRGKDNKLMMKSVEKNLLIALIVLVVIAWVMGNHIQIEEKRLTIKSIHLTVIITMIHLIMTHEKIKHTVVMRMMMKRTVNNIQKVAKAVVVIKRKGNYLNRSKLSTN